MKVEKVGPGYAICADSTVPGIQAVVRQLTGDVPLIIADPPYGNVLKAGWDRRYGDDEEKFVVWMKGWTLIWSRIMMPNSAFYVWGGIGRPGFRPFFRYLAEVEKMKEANLKIANLITWKKKRAYGVQHNYLFTREECVYLFKGDDVKKPRCFNVPLLEEKRGYAGYNKKYPAKSEQYRRTNVWTDVTEVMRDKVHDAQKAQRVIEVPIEVHTQPGEWVIDPFVGSGTTALAALKLGRRFVVIERDEQIYRQMVERLVEAVEGRVSSDGAAPCGADEKRIHDGRRDGREEATHRKRAHGREGDPGEATGDDRSLRAAEGLRGERQVEVQRPPSEEERPEVGPHEEGEDGSSLHESRPTDQ